MDKACYNIVMFNFDLDWRSKRRLAYIAALFIMVLGFIFYKLYPVLFPAPTCLDKKMNGFELGVDCGGSCLLQCKGSYADLKVVLQTVFPARDKSNDIFVLFENTNQYVAPANLGTSIDLYDTRGKLVSTIKKTVLAGTQKYIPVLISNYSSSSTLSKVFVKDITYDMHETYGAYDVSLVDYGLDVERTKLNIKIKSIYKEDINHKLRLYVLLRDDLDNIVAMNYQDINGILFEEVKSLNFLWTEKIEGNIKNIDLITVSNLYK